MKYEKIVGRQRGIAVLHELAAEDCEPFGAKTAGLVVAIAAGAPVLPGIAVSVALARMIAEDKDSGRWAECLAPHLTALARYGASGRFIVRSSSRYEDAGQASFSGMFETVANARTAQEVVEAIALIVDGARSLAREPYFVQSGASLQADHMAVLIQPQASPDLGGILRLGPGSVEVEYTRGDLARAIAGVASYSSATLRGNSVIHRSVAPGDAGVDLEPVWRVLSGTAEFWECARVQGLLVEFLVESGAFFVAQAKRSSSGVLPAADKEARRLLDNRLANKTRAMRFFADNDLFDMPMRIVPAGADLGAVQRAAAELLETCPAITVRLSRGAEIGLPRLFCASAVEARVFAEAHAAQPCDIILHGYISVERSLELLIDRNGFLVEHVPGMWESPNTLQPDVVAALNGEVTTYQFNALRTPQFETRTEERADVARPLGRDDLDKLSLFAERVWVAVTRAFEDQLPLNVHAVCDSRFDAFQCLNIRPGFAPADRVVPAGNMRSVSRLSDLDGWSEDQPIRLSLSLARGAERTIVPLADRLARARHPVVIDFGMLSHPAMILRERGCRLVPSYQVPFCLPAGSYTLHRRSVDFGSAPVDRIMREKPVIASPTYHVVPDREPILPQHVIGVSKCASASTADTGALAEVARIEAEFAGGDDVLFFEKGRADFCTSAFTFPRDHFHLLKGRDFEPILASLRASVGGTRIATLEEAYAGVETFGPYLVFGTRRLGYYRVMTAGRLPKRLLRTAF